MHSQVPIRDEQLNVRLNPEEMAMARKVAEHLGLTPGFLVRMLIREKARDLGLVPSSLAEAAVLAGRAKPTKKR